MTHEEMHKVACDMKQGVKMMVEKLGEVGQKKATWSMAEMGEAADIMKDLSCVMKNLAKAHYYTSMKSEDRY